MAERLNNFGLLPLRLDNLVDDRVVKIHPTLDCPDSLTNPVDVAAALSANDLTLTGHRTLVLPSRANGEVRIVVKGYFPSPVHVYGERAEEELARSLKFYSTEGEFAGKATEDDVLYEYEVLGKLRKRNPEVIADPNVPIWQLLRVGFTGNEIKIWRENDKRPRKQAIVFRRFPYTQWRVADSFIVDDTALVEHELDRLQSIWNVNDRKGTYLKSIGRFARAQGFLHNADLPHGNLYWRWFDHNLQRTYSRPNTHNVALDGSIGDFEKPDKLYRADESNIDVRETIFQILCS